MTAPVDLSALGRKLVTLTSTAKASGRPRFRWMPGMRDTSGDRVEDAHWYDSAGFPVGPLWYSGDYGPARRAWKDGDPLPDLADPATLGCIEHGLIPDAWGASSSLETDLAPTIDGGWVFEFRVWDGDLNSKPMTGSFVGRTREEALALGLFAVLEAAP